MLEAEIKTDPKITASLSSTSTHQTTLSVSDLYSIGFEHNPQGLFVLSLADETTDPLICRFRLTNPAFCRLFGVSPTHVNGSSPQACLPHESAEALLTHSLRASQVRQAVVYEDAYLQPGRILAITVSPQPDADPLVLIGSVQDITQQKQSLQGFQQAQATLKVILDSNLQSTLLIDKDYRILAFNQSAIDWVQEVWGEPLQVGNSIFPLVHPNNLQDFKRDFQRVLAGESITTERQICREGATEKWYEFNYTPIPDQAGQIVGVCSTTVSIDQRKTESALRLSEARYRAILNAIPDLMMRLNAQGQYLDIQGDPQLMIAPSEQIIGKTLIDLLPPEVATLAKHFMRQVLQTGQMQIFKYPLTLAQGIRYFEARLVACGSDEVLGIIRDITDQHRSEVAQQRQSDREQLLASIALRIRRSLDLGEILYTATAEVRQLLAVDRVLIYQFQPNGDGWVIAEAVDPKFPRALGSVVLKPWFGALLISYQRGEVRAVEQIEQQNLYPEPLRQFFDHLEVKSHLVIPMFQAGGLWGLLVAHHCAGQRAWQPNEISLLQKLATQIEIAIQQAQLYQQVQTLNDELERKVRVRTAQLNKQVAALNLQAQLLDTVDSAIVATNEAGHVTFWNEYAQQLYGLSQEAALGEWLGDVIPFPPDQQSEMMRALSGGQKWSGEFSILHPQGGIATLFVEHTPMRGSDGSGIGTIGISIDISARKQAENALRESEAKFRTLAETATSAIFIFQYRFLDVNAALSRITQYTRDQLLQMSFLQLIHPDFQLIVERLIQAQLQGRLEASRQEFKVFTQSGGERWIDCTLGLIQFGGQAAILGTAFDITQRKYAELQLQQKMEELQTLNMLKDDFLSTVSHELRTPMANMKMAIHMLKMNVSELSAGSNRPEKIERYLSILQEECGRETELINDLLDLQRLESGSHQPHYERLVLQQWIPLAIQAFESRIQQRQQTLLLDIAPDLPSLLTDRTSLGRILSELVNNACKYSPPEADIFVQAQAKSDSTIRIRVTNTGSEIPPSEAERIFDKFYRIPNGDRWKQGGTGLGLALVKRLVDQMQGQIWVQSQDGETTFTIDLPPLSAEDPS